MNENISGRSGRTARPEPETSRSRSNYRKVTITLPPEQEAFLAQFALSLRTQGGRKLATTEIVRALIIALESLDPDLNVVRSEEELAQRILMAVPRANRTH
jgi:hypothetical protein